MRPASCGSHYCGLRRAAACRHRSEQGTTEIGSAGRDQFTVGIDGRVIRADEGPTGSDRLGEAHQRDTERPRYERLDQFEVRQRKWRESRGNEADGRDTKRVQSEEP